MPSPREKPIRNAFGMSLVDTLVAVAIMGILTVGMLSLFDTQRKQVQLLMQKQDIIDLKNLMLQAFDQPDVCTWQLKDKVVDVSMATSELIYSPSVVKLNDDTLFSGTDSASAKIAVAKKSLPNSLNGLKVDSISFRNIYAKGLPDQYQGVFQISFDESMMSMPLKPVHLPVVIMTDPASPTSAKRIINCRRLTNPTSLRTEGAKNVGGSTCPSVLSSGTFCDTAFTKRINFSQAFPRVPKIMVAHRGNSIATYCPCCSGASDQMLSWTENESASGFDVRTSISPVSLGACAPYENHSPQMSFDWIAVGEYE